MFTDFGFGGAMFSIVPVIVVVGFVVVLGIIIFRAVSGAVEWKKNNDSPRLSVQARVVTKRESVHHHHVAGEANHMHMSSSTTYYVTFEVQSGDRMEFKVKSMDYGLLAQGDMGTLTFQGTRFLGFDRHRENAAS